MAWNDRALSVFPPGGRPALADRAPRWAGSDPATRLASLSTALLLAMGLAGCTAVMNRQSPLTEVTQDSPTALAVYRAGPGGQVSGYDRPAAAAAAPHNPAQGTPAARAALYSASPTRVVTALDTQDSVYWSALEPMRQRFARVPNPDLVMVVYPHLAKGRYPVPGYVTTFPMYEQVQYALPGEVEGELLQARSVQAAAPQTARGSLPNTAAPQRPKASTAPGRQHADGAQP